MIIAFWDREEDGLLGSQAYTQSPLVPLADTVGYVNFDIQGANLLPALRNTTFAVGAESGGTRFQDIVQAAADPQSLDTHLFSAIFGQGRSDYANFLNVDVPSVFFTDSTGPCYHTNQDEPGIVDYGKLDQQIATALATTRELGNTTNPPAWTENDPVVYQDVVTFAGVVDLAATNIDRFSAQDQQTITNIQTRVDTIRDDGPDEFEQQRRDHPDRRRRDGREPAHARHLRGLRRRPGVAGAMAHPNDELIERFYGAFARHDGDAMAACYAPDAHFSDPVFTDLHGEEPGAMWRMLTGRAEDLEIRLAEHEAEDTRGQRPLAGGLHVQDRPQGPQRRPRRVPLRERPDQGAPRLVLVLRLGAAGAGAHRPRARLDADRALEGPERGPLGPRRVPRPLALGARPDRSQPPAPDERASRVHERPVEPEAASRAGVGGHHAGLGAEDATVIAVRLHQKVEAGLEVARLGEALELVRPTGRSPPLGCQKRPTSPYASSVSDPRSETKPILSMPSRIGPSTRRRERRKSAVGSVRSPISTSITGTSREVTARAAAAPPRVWRRRGSSGVHRNPTPARVDPGRCRR